MATSFNSLNIAINSTRAYVNMKVRKAGRVRPPNLPDAQLKAIGLKAVAEQKARWARVMNANGQPAKKLSVRYAIIKQAVLHKRAVRDMWLSGRTVANFQLRKAADGKIRAENSTRAQRDAARGANNYDQMIGIALTDANVIITATKVEYGSYVKKAWIPMDGTGRRPSALNVVPA
jgi:hypothetical protein